MMKSAEYKRGYDAGYKQALLDALKQQAPIEQRRMGGPDAPKPYIAPLPHLKDIIR